MSIIDLLDVDREENRIMYGVTVGIITNNQDPDKLGRVKCRILNRDKEENETDWIRVASFMTGKDRGAFFLPEVDDEVLISFNGGDIHQPYVIGSLWNKKDTIIETNEDGKNNIRKIKSRIGHELEFCDDKDNPEIRLHTQGERDIILNDKEEIINIKDKDKKNYIKIESKNGQISVIADKKIQFKAGTCTIEMDGNSNTIKIQSDTSIKIKSQQINIEAGGSMSIKSSGMLDVKSSAMLNIKGSMVKIN